MKHDLNYALFNLDKARRYLRIAWDYLKKAGRDDLAIKLNNHFTDLTELTTEVEKEAAE